MTRIIAGELGGRTLSVPKTGTRPTSDRVREAIFSRLDHAGALREAHVLDLYAGSGALGIEALSRGAASATLVEHAGTAARVITANVAALDLTGRATVVRERALPYVERATREWDVVFMDPPYDITDADLAAVLAATAGRLAPQASLVLEISSRHQAPTWPAALEVVQTKVYGETTVHYAERLR